MELLQALNEFVANYGFWLIFALIMLKQGWGYVKRGGTVKKFISDKLPQLMVTAEQMFKSTPKSGVQKQQYVVNQMLKLLLGSGYKDTEHTVNLINNQIESIIKLTKKINSR